MSTLQEVKNEWEDSMSTVVFDDWVGHLYIRIYRKDEEFTLQRFFPIMGDENNWVVSVDKHDVDITEIFTWIFEKGFRELI
jgi:hypothetical protein